MLVLYNFIIHIRNVIINIDRKMLQFLNNKGINVQKVRIRFRYIYNQNHPLNGWFEKALKGLDTDTAP